MDALMNAKNITLKLSYLTLACAYVGLGCSSSNNPASTEPVTKLGTVFISSYPLSVGRKADIVAFFEEYDEDVSNAVELIWKSTDDRCDISSFDSLIFPEVSESQNNGRLISAGKTLIVSSPDGTLLTLVPGMQSVLGYYGNESLTLSTDMTLDISGNDDFPAFSNVAIPDAPTLENFDHLDRQLTQDSTLSWTGSNNPDTQLNITISSDELTYANSSIDCTIIDDGTFKLPTEVVSKIGNFSNGSVVYGGNRLTVNIVQSGSTLLVIQHTAKHY